MNENDGGILDEVCFPRNKDGWILVSQILGHKVIVTSSKQPKSFRYGNPNNQHREFFLELDTSVKIRPKLEIDISKFVQEKRSRN
jgi:hypothetical protein